MKNQTNWEEYDAGYTIGTVGADDGAVVRDEEHISAAARITMEEESSFAPFVVTCQIYGWLRHTRYFEEEAEAENEFEVMKNELEEILETLPVDAENIDEETREEILETLEMFAEKFP